MDKNNSRLQLEIESYSAYHQSRANQLTHIIGIPLILFSLFCGLGWLRFLHTDIPLSGGTLLFLGLVIFYVRIHLGLGIAFAVWSFPIFLLAQKASVTAFPMSLFITLGTFVVGWGFQWLGHSVEKNRPAFLTNLSHLWRGPLFISYKLGCSLGLRF